MMKVDFIKALLAAFSSVLLGYLCYEISPETENQNVIAWIVCSLSTFLTLLPATAITVPESGNRNLSGKVYLWACFAVIFVTNLIFCCFTHGNAPLMITIGLECILAVYVSYAILKK
jgi:hypothetical protein